MKAYTVKYRLDGEYSEMKSISFLAKNKFDAYDKATFELIPEKDGRMPYASWVYSVTYNNGNEHIFDTGGEKAY